MSDPFIAEIKIFGGNFAPRGFAFCNGQLLQIAQNTALFSLVGTTYGGDGRVTFGLPNLQGRVPVHSGDSAGPGLTNRPLGSSGGTETETLTVAQMPAHRHGTAGSSDDTDEEGDTSVQGNLTGTTDASDRLYTDATADPVDMDAIAQQGGNQAHINEQPYLALHYIIALVGTFPSRS